VIVDADYAFPLPASMTFEWGAGLPLNYVTAHFLLVRRAKLQPGENRAGSWHRRRRRSVD
jgi:NADPH:quinone reductase